MTCANCTQDAAWVHDDPGALPVAYCDGCLPFYLRPRAVNGSLTKVEQPEPVVEETPKRGARKAVPSA